MANGVLLAGVRSPRRGAAAHGFRICGSGSAADRAPRCGRDPGDQDGGVASGAVRQSVAPRVASLPVNADSEHEPKGTGLSHKHHTVHERGRLRNWSRRCGGVASLRPSTLASGSHECRRTRQKGERTSRPGGAPLPEERCPVPQAGETVRPCADAELLVRKKNHRLTSRCACAKLPRSRPPTRETGRSTADGLADRWRCARGNRGTNGGKRGPSITGENLRKFRRLAGLALCH